METINDYELLTAYILGELQADEKTALEQKISTTPQLQEKLQDLQDLKAIATEQKGIDVLKQSIAQARKNNPQNTAASANVNEPKRIVLKWLRPLAAIAATLVFILGASYFFNGKTDGKTDGKAVYARHAVQPIEQTMNGIADTPKYNEGIAAFNKNDLQTAKKILAELAETSDNPNILVPLARCYTALDEYAHAETVIGLLDQQQYEESNWLRACLLLRKGDFNAASSLLKRVISNSKSANQQQAAAILEEIS